MQSLHDRNVLIEFLENKELKVFTCAKFKKISKRRKLKKL